MNYNMLYIICLVIFVIMVTFVAVVWAHLLESCYTKSREPPNDLGIPPEYISPVATDK